MSQTFKFCLRKCLSAVTQADFRFSHYEPRSPHRHMRIGTFHPEQNKQVKDNTFSSKPAKSPDVMLSHLQNANGYIAIYSNLNCKAETGRAAKTHQGFSLSM